MYQLIAGQDGMTIHNFSILCYIKKGLLLTVIRTRGLVETRRCAAAEARSQLIITTPVHSYTWYTGVSQNNFLRQKYLAFNFWKIFPILLFSVALRPYIFATPFAKNALLFPPLSNPRIFPRFFFYHSFFHPFLTNANYLCRRTFWNLPA